MYTYFYVKTTFYFGHDGNLLSQENFYFYFNLIAFTHSSHREVQKRV